MDSWATDVNDVCTGHSPSLLTEYPLPRSFSSDLSPLGRRPFETPDQDGIVYTRFSNGPLRSTRKRLIYRVLPLLYPRSDPEPVER
jgi:hypothetical protein